MKRYSLEDLGSKPLVVVFQDTARYYIDDDRITDYDKIIAEMQDRFIRNGYPIYPDIKRAALAVSKMIDYYERKR
jgi:hypothetical protein